MRRINYPNECHTHVALDSSQMQPSPRPLAKTLLELGTVIRGQRCQVETLPFAKDDATAGIENEFQVAVRGKRDNVDLVRAIEQSNFYAGLLRRVSRGDVSSETVTELQRFLRAQEEHWENSWVRFPMRCLSSYAHSVLDRDLLADKSNPKSGLRSDHESFIVKEAGENYLRIPISYLLNLALADVVGSSPSLPPAINETAVELLKHFSNDNTSPEITSFYLVRSGGRTSLGRTVAKETALRFMLTQLLAMYANSAFALKSSGQEVLVYAAPTTPLRQKQLNRLIPDSFYRELFMSPCLSGWDRGEEKKQYMHLCHEVLSRSQLNTIGKLREAGILANDLIRLPRLSNTCLANNGTHISIGSISLSRFRAGASPHFSPRDEKVVGDLVIKFVEHFLPLFVGTLSAAPQRIAYTEFRPETILGFLPHELDYTHLRMLWRRWQSKADLRIFGYPVPPFGPRALDRFLERFFRLKGDFVPDFRLIDYFAALMSTEEHGSLDGSPGNCDKLKRDLEQHGIFDRRMAFYSLYRLREYDHAGYCGFEGRHHSLFPSLKCDMSAATDLQLLITLLAYKYIAEGRITHDDIPDSPALESERRQVFFDAAIGLPTFFVKRNTANRFLRDILAITEKTRVSRRYRGYIRVQNIEYRKALLHLLEEEAEDIIDSLDLSELLSDLRERLNTASATGAAATLLQRITARSGGSSPMAMKAADFNIAAEEVYREDIRRCYLEEAFDYLNEEISEIRNGRTSPACLDAVEEVLELRKLPERVNSAKEDILNERADCKLIAQAIHLLLFVITHLKTLCSKELQTGSTNIQKVA